MTLSGKTLVAGIVGAPVTHSLSPVIHNAWLAAAGIDGVYVPFAVAIDRFAAFAEGLRGGGSVMGVNVTVPFKEAALAAADRASDRARAAGAANVLVFGADDTLAADNTDGVGLLAALASTEGGFDPLAGPAVVFGAGGAARGAVSALIAAGVPEIRLVNRSADRAAALATAFGPKVRVAATAETAVRDATVIVNATTLGLGGGPGPMTSFEAAPRGVLVMDMVYKPLRTPFLQAARAAGLRTADGLTMLIAQAAPSFEAFFGQPPPDIDVRSLCLNLLGETE